MELEQVMALFVLTIVGIIVIGVCGFPLIDGDLEGRPKAIALIGVVLGLFCFVPGFFHLWVKAVFG